VSDFDMGFFAGMATGQILLAVWLHALGFEVRQKDAGVERDE